MPRHWKDRTFYTPAELADMTPEQREQAQAKHRANPVQPEEMSPAYRAQSLAGARTALEQELAGQHREAS